MIIVMFVFMFLVILVLFSRMLLSVVDNLSNCLFCLLYRICIILVIFRVFFKDGVSGVFMLEIMVVVGYFVKFVVWISEFVSVWVLLGDFIKVLDLSFMLSIRCLSFVVSFLDRIEVVIRLRFFIVVVIFCMV